MKTKTFFRAAIMAAVLVTTASCEYKDLVDYSSMKDMTSMRISFDWSKVDSIPEEMRVVMYPKNDYTGIRGYTIFDVQNRDTVVEIPSGAYNMTAWNRDMEHVITSGYSLQRTVNATTGPYSSHGNYLMPKVLDSLYVGQQVLDYPDYMVHSFQNGIEMQKDVENELIVTPDSMVVTVEVRLNGIKGLEHCKSVRATMNNVSGKRYMSYDNLTENSVIIMYDAMPNEKNDNITAKFWIFGIEPSEFAQTQYEMIAFFWLDAGQIYIPFNVTKSMSKYTKEDKYILIDSPDLGIDLRDFLTPTSGFDVTIDEWDNVDVQIDF